MRRSLETEQTETLDAPLLNARLEITREAGTIAARELRTPDTQAQQTAAIATRNPNAIVELPPTAQTLAVKAQVAEAIAKHRQEQKRQRTVEYLFNGDGGPYEWHADVFETFQYALASGMSTSSALRQASQNAHEELQTLFADIAAHVEQGATLTEAFKAHQDYLPDIVVPIFEHGLIYGTAENAARQTARALQKLATVQTKFEYSALNPGFVFPLVVGGIIILGSVPICFLCADPLIPYTLFCTTMLGIGVLGWKFRHKLARRRRKHVGRSKRNLKGNVGGFVHRRMGGAQWSRTFEALWHCGVPISSALEAAGRSTRNAYYEQVLCNAAQSARNGVSLGDSLAQVRLVKGEIIETIRTGELTGDLGTSLEQCANVLEDDARERAGQLLFLYTIGVIFLGALIVCLLALTFAYFYSGRPMHID